MTHHQPVQDDDVAALLDAERDLTRKEMSLLRRTSREGWASILQLLSGRAKSNYAAASSEDFTVCVMQHMDELDREAMVGAEVYFCPTCDRTLKDRRTPVASAIMLERRRMRDLWLRVEQAPPEAMNDALDAFRRALGLRTT